MAAKLMAIERPHACSRCERLLPAATRAWWDGVEHTVVCIACRPPATARPIGLPAARVRRLQRIDRRATATERPQSTSGWAHAGDGDRRLSSYLDRELVGHATVLHGLRVQRSRSRIDHLVVAPSGIWVIDARNDLGKVECHGTGGWSRSDLGLFVANRNRTRLIRAIRRRTEAVARTLAPIGLSRVPIHRCLCFANADWRVFSRPFSIDGVWIGWPDALVTAARATRVLEDSAVATLAQHLDTQLSASR